MNVDDALVFIRFLAVADLKLGFREDVELQIQRAVRVDERDTGQMPIALVLPLSIT